MIQLLVAVQKSHHEIVDREQCRGADDAADKAVVVADDRVLNGVRECQKHDQIERVKRRQFTLTGQSQTDNQERVDQDGTQNLLQKGDVVAQSEQVLPNVRHR